MERSERRKRQWTPTLEDLEGRRLLNAGGARLGPIPASQEQAPGPSFFLVRSGLDNPSRRFFSTNPRGITGAIANRNLRGHLPVSNGEINLAGGFGDLLLSPVRSNTQIGLRARPVSASSTSSPSSTGTPGNTAVNPNASITPSSIINIGAGTAGASSIAGINGFTGQVGATTNTGISTVNGATSSLATSGFGTVTLNTSGPLSTSVTMSTGGFGGGGGGGGFGAAGGGGAGTGFGGLGGLPPGFLGSTGLASGVITTLPTSPSFPPTINVIGGGVGVA